MTEAGADELIGLGMGISILIIELKCRVISRWNKATGVLSKDPTLKWWVTGFL